MDVSAIEKRLRTGKKVCVIGAGTMGSGIAAHLANLGFEVSLLDVTPESVHAAFERAKHARPPHFYLRGTADQIRLGSVIENLDWVSEADWVCEAIIEKFEAKRALLESIDGLVSEDALISSNTSGLEIATLIEGRSESFQKRFIGSHFFNPPRYLKLLELIDTNMTHPELLSIYTEFFENRVAKRVVRAKDTPGFIANRYGMWSMYQAVHIAEKLQMSIEDVDLITGPFLGRPRSASFRLNDLVGIDIMDDIARNLITRCPDDPYIGTLTTPKSIEHLLACGNIGEKSSKGYYDRIGNDFLSIDFQTFAYRPKKEAQIEVISEVAKRPIGERIRHVLDSKTEAGEFLRLYLIPTLRYADHLKSEISYSIQSFDQVMQWGFGWELGPFALIDTIGGESILGRSNQYYRSEELGSLQLSLSGNGYVPVLDEPQFRSLESFPVVEETSTLKLRELGDGVTSIETKTKLGSINPQVVEEFQKLLDERPEDAFVYTQPGRSFSVGFDLNFFLDAIQREDWVGIEAALGKLQTLGETLEKSNVVSVLHGYALGGGLELGFSCPGIIVHAESTIGLPESRVGLIPGGRGTVLARLWNQDGHQSLTDRIMSLTEGATASNAFEAKSLGFLPPHAAIEAHPDLLLWHAKHLAIELKEKSCEKPIRPDWKPVAKHIGGAVDDLQQKLMSNRQMSRYDEFIGDHIKNLMVKCESYEQAVVDERHRFLEMCKRPETKARIEHMLSTGKPLKN